MHEFVMEGMGTGPRIGEPGGGSRDRGLIFDGTCWGFGLVAVGIS